MFLTVQEWLRQHLLKKGVSL